MYKLLPLLAVLLLCLPTPVSGLERQDSLLLRVMSYNMENLFDFEHDSLKQDMEFTPEGLRRWTAGRYYRKLDRIAKVILAAGTEEEVPMLVGACEVENERVMDDLTRRSLLRRLGYRYVMTQSQDVRGIDVALLYQPHRFKLLEHRCYSVSLPDRRPTRDVLHVVGRLANNDTLDVFVLHFPSKSGGAKVTEEYRCHVARSVRHLCDSLCKVRSTPQLLLMGDLNEPVTEPAISQVLAVKSLPSGWKRTIEQKFNGRPLRAEAYRPDSTAVAAPSSLYSLLDTDKKEPLFRGSYKYQGKWETIDHLIVNGTLLRKENRLQVVPGSSRVAPLPFLLTKDEKYGGEMPFRTYYGIKHQQGYSDHLPLITDLLLIY